MFWKCVDIVCCRSVRYLFLVFCWLFIVLVWKHAFLCFCCCLIKKNYWRFEFYSFSPLLVFLRLRGSNFDVRKMFSFFFIHINLLWTVSSKSIFKFIRIWIPCSGSCNWFKIDMNDRCYHRIFVAKFSMQKLILIASN